MENQFGFRCLKYKGMGKVKEEIQMHRQLVISKSFKLNSIVIHNAFPWVQSILDLIFLQRNGLNSVDLRTLTD